MSITLNGTTGIVSPKVNALDLELDSKNVVESGSNANGEYVRFADGTQICTRYLHEALRSIDGVSVPFPAEFAAGTVSGGVFVGSASGPTRNDIRDAQFITYTVDTAWIYSSRVAGTALDASRTRCIAIGRWY